MNPFLLWAPGTALIVVGALLMVMQVVTTPVAVVIIVIGAVLESAGVLLWIRSRRESSARR